MRCLRQRSVKKRFPPINCIAEWTLVKWASWDLHYWASSFCLILSTPMRFFLYSCKLTRLWSVQNTNIGIKSLKWRILLTSMRTSSSMAIKEGRWKTEWLMQFLLNYKSLWLMPFRYWWRWRWHSTSICLPLKIISSFVSERRTCITLPLY